jgi:biopolymer transport protein ExbD
MRESNEEQANAKPFINVTPLIDVLLVMLIIFMVVSPTKPHRFRTQVPEPLDTTRPPPPTGDMNLRVDLDASHNLSLNGVAVGSLDNTSVLTSRLTEVFMLRLANRMDKWGTGKEWRTVYVKAPRGTRYGDVVRVIDGIKAAGADPIGLQVDALN